MTHGAGYPVEERIWFTWELRSIKMTWKNFENLAVMDERKNLKMNDGNLFILFFLKNYNVVSWTIGTMVELKIQYSNRIHSQMLLQYVGDGLVFNWVQTRELYDIWLNLHVLRHSDSWNWMTYRIELNWLLKPSISLKRHLFKKKVNFKHSSSSGEGYEESKYEPRSTVPSLITSLNKHTLVEWRNEECSKAYMCMFASAFSRHQFCAAVLLLLFLFFLFFASMWLNWI